MERDEIIYEKVKQALIKRALGYETSETVEEYASDGGENMTVVKRKVTTKPVAPDISAAKLLLESIEADGQGGLGRLSDQQLEQEKQRLLKLLKEMNTGENSKKRR